VYNMCCPYVEQYNGLNWGRNYIYIFYKTLVQIKRIKKSHLYKTKQMNLNNCSMSMLEEFWTVNMFKTSSDNILQRKKLFSNNPSDIIFWIKNPKWIVNTRSWLWIHIIVLNDYKFVMDIMKYRNFQYITK
jgi:hypothetical protein